nr:MAG TPA: hypothetical protein [Caudoviricetes sp.]
MALILRSISSYCFYITKMIFELCYIEAMAARIQRIKPLIISECT